MVMAGSSSSAKPQNILRESTPAMCHVHSERSGPSLGSSCSTISPRRGYSRTTVPPAASSAALIFSASSLEAFALISCGRDSTSFFACERDKVRGL